MVGSGQRAEATGLKRCACGAVAGGVQAPQLPSGHRGCETSAPALLFSWMTICKPVEPSISVTQAADSAIPILKRSGEGMR